MYLLLKNIDVRGANALSAYPVVSGISPLTIAGFVRNLAIKLGLDVTSNLDFVMIHHDMQLRAEKSLSNQVIPMQKNGALLTSTSQKKQNGSTDYSGSSMNLSMQPIVECDARLSLVIDFGYDDVSEKCVAHLLPLMRIGGGQIQSCDWVGEFDSEIDALKRAGFGYVMTERSDLLDVAPEDRAQAFIDSLYPVKLPRDHQEKSRIAETKEWIVPFNLGWLPLTGFKAESGARNGLDHAIAEPLIGLVQVTPIRRAIKEKMRITWRRKKISSAYVVTTNL